MRATAHHAISLMKTMKYKKAGEEKPLTDTCAICLEEFLHKQVISYIHTDHTHW